MEIFHLQKRKLSIPSPQKYDIYSVSSAVNTGGTFPPEETVEFPQSFLRVDLMSTSIVAPCPSCRAIVNLTWKVCPTCSAPTTSLVKAGDSITWHSAAGRSRNGLVDFLHVDPDGTAWAFYTFPDGRWGAVNMKYVTVVEQDG